jgi:hypothetical protein
VLLGLTEAGGRHPLDKPLPWQERGLQKDWRVGRMDFSQFASPGSGWALGAAFGRPSAFLGSGLRRFLRLGPHRMRVCNGRRDGEHPSRAL